MVILVVDDDPVSRLVAEHVLRSGGHELHSVASAEEAHEITDELRNDLALIVCDYSMPGASGLDLLEALNASGQRVPPFVLVTGFGEADELDDPRADLVDAYLTKPVQSGELLSLVDTLVAASVD